MGINDNIIAADQPHVAIGRLEGRWQEGGRRGRVSSVLSLDDGQVLSSASPRCIPTTTGLILHPPDPAGVSAAKDTEVSAERLGNIVHQAASVMAGSL